MMCKLDMDCPGYGCIAFYIDGFQIERTPTCDFCRFRLSWALPRGLSQRQDRQRCGQMSRVSTRMPLGGGAIFKAAALFRRAQIIEYAWGQKPCQRNRSASPVRSNYQRQRLTS